MEPIRLPFQIPPIPENGFDLVKLIIFEPIFLINFSNTLSKKESLYWLFKTYLLVILITLLLYIPSYKIMEILPIHEYLSNGSLSEFNHGINVSCLLNFLLGLSFGLSVGLIVTLTAGFAHGVTAGFTFGLTGGVVGGLTFCFPLSKIGIIFELFLVGSIMGLTLNLSGQFEIIRLCFGLYLKGFKEFILVVIKYSKKIFTKSSYISFKISKKVAKALFICIAMLLISYFLLTAISTDGSSSSSSIALIVSVILFFILIFSLLSSLAILVGLTLVIGLIISLIYIVAQFIGFALPKTSVEFSNFVIFITPIAISGILSFVISYFRFILYLYYFLKWLFVSADFKNNPYLNDGSIRLKIPHVYSSLIFNAKKHPQIAEQFSDFLLEFRPHQLKLATIITHVATASRWQRGAYSFDAESFKHAIIHKKMSKLYPSKKWFRELDKLRSQLIASQYETHSGLKKDRFESFTQLLKDFRKLTLRESSFWNHYYLPALDTWEKLANEEIQRLKNQSEIREPMLKNIYRPGEELSPNSDSFVFIGREDVKEQLMIEIETSVEMPLFLIHGQRRVGKSSLLNFLTDMLGPRFKVIRQNMQSEKTVGVINWLKDLYFIVNKFLQLPNNELNISENWLEAWERVREYLEKVSKNLEFRLIIAFDEYENHHRNLNDNPEAAERLLGAIRTFSLEQRNIVLLFVGSSLFSELKHPNWNEYFVHAKHILVDYLKFEDTAKLISPYPNFPLVFPDEYISRIFYLTKGHPALIQQICSEIVNLANREQKREISISDLEFVIKNYLIQRENLSIQIFWTQFCSEIDKECILKILNGDRPTDERSLSRLERHGFIILENNDYQIRVPLYKLWLERFARTF